MSPRLLPLNSSVNLARSRTEHTGLSFHLQDLLKCTPEEDPEYEELQKVLTMVDNGPFRPFLALKPLRRGLRTDAHWAPRFLTDQ